MRSMLALIRSSRCCSYSFTGAAPCAAAASMAKARETGRRQTGPGRRAQATQPYALTAGRSETPHRLGRGAQRVSGPPVRARGRTVLRAGVSPSRRRRCLLGAAFTPLTDAPPPLPQTPPQRGAVAC
jgi:hypothetical protein